MTTTSPTTTTDALDLIGKHLEATLRGEPLTSFRDDACGHQLAALRALTGSHTER